MLFSKPTSFVKSRPKIFLCFEKKNRSCQNICEKYNFNDNPILFLFTLNDSNLKHYSVRFMQTNEYHIYYILFAFDQYFTYLTFSADTKSVPAYKGEK